MSHDPSRGEFCVLIGGERWAFELTEPEWRDLVDLVATLERQHRGLVDQLMSEESIELELDRGVWWGCLSGDRSQWDLHILLTSREGRSAEGEWPAPAAEAVVAAMRTLWDSQH